MGSSRAEREAAPECRLPVAQTADDGEDNLAQPEPESPRTTGWKSGRRKSVAPRVSLAAGDRGDTPKPDRRCLALLAALVATSAASRAEAEDWPTPGLDGAHTRLTGERSGSRFGDQRWSLRGAGRILASPVVADGFVITADLDGSVRAIRAENGELAWQVPLASPVQGAPAIARGRVFVPTVSNKLVAMRLVDGQRLWARDVGGMVLSSPASIGGDLVVAAGFPSRQVVRVSGETGDVMWSSPPVMTQSSNTAPAVAGDLVVVGSQGGQYYAFDAGTGHLRWNYQADGIVHLAAPLIVGNRVYLAGGDTSHRVHAVDAATGLAVPGWPVDLPTPAPDVIGTVVGKQRAVSAPMTVSGWLLLQTRIDYTIDTAANGKRFLSRESVLALDAGVGSIRWEHAVARVELGDQNDVPKFYVCPTPAGFTSLAGSGLVAVASSLTGSVVVLDATGNEQTRIDVAGPALASPVLANGRLITVATNGSVEGFASSVNHPPAAPILSGYAKPLDAADVTLRWLASSDPDAEVPSYELRIDDDGELLESWKHQLSAGAGATSLTVAVPLSVGVTYTYAMRARDGRGALSAWSLPETFSVTVNPPVLVGGKAIASLRAATAAAQPGDVMTLGPGTYALTQTLNVGEGVSIQGAGANLTTIDAARMGVGISFDRSNPDHSSRLEGVTVTGADTCVQVGDGATGVQIRRVIVRNCRVHGVAVRSSGGVDIANATLVSNGVGVQSAGVARIKNSLLTGNATALAVDNTGNGKLTSSYNDLFGNPKDYVGLTSGVGDLAAAVAFADLKAHDLRLFTAQPSTDRGDPSDDVGEEPAPNGGRINLGAFGGTAAAESTGESTAVAGADGGVPAPAPTWIPSTPTARQAAAPSAASDSDAPAGCRIAGGSDAGGLVAVLTCVTAVLARQRKRNRESTTRNA
jgi:outer membrane protein assembly factor BamB